MTQAGRNRAAALALLAGVVAVLAAAAIAPASIRWAAAGDSIDADRARIVENESQSRSAAALESAEAQWRDFAADPGAGFSLAESDEAARAEVESVLRTAFVAHGGAAEEVRSEALTAVREGVSKIEVQASGGVSKTELAAFLRALEDGRPHFIMQRVEAETDASDEAMILVRLDGAVLRLDGGEL